MLTAVKVRREYRIPLGSIKEFIGNHYMRNALLRKEKARHAGSSIPAWRDARFAKGRILCSDLILAVYLHTQLLFFIHDDKIVVEGN